ncbi:uncharacterized protein DNG_07969 [Cephalotrichum gorgonifer]|uniref:Uncharacterized protein n=1 Tax=Cephalotrichum gorgonifer TaxID=2041049 RepID=A0AAE8SYR0_9PEZI|nr:uncharacterized protein DNG_07969 [Cephalotrichum gorgonifer]
MSDHKDAPPSYDSVAGTTYQQPIPEPAPRESTSRSAASTVDSTGYVPTKCMSASWADSRHPRWVKMEGEDGVLCSSSGGVLCSEHGGVLCSDHGGVFCSDHDGVLCSDRGGVVCSDNGGACCSDGALGRR